MSATLDEIAPDYMGDDRVSVTLQEGSPTTAFVPLWLRVNYDECAPEGVMLPLELIVRGPSSVKRKIYSRNAPTLLHYKPVEGGTHLIMLREVAHNRWWGRLKVDVRGPNLNRPRLA